MTPKLLTAEELAEIAKREKAALQGPWEADVREERSSREVNHAVYSPNGKAIFDTLNSEDQCIYHDGEGVYHDTIGRPNMEFCAHARTDIPALLSHISALDARCKELEGALRDATVLLKRGSSEIYVIANSESFSRDCKAVLESLSALEGGSR